MTGVEVKTRAVTVAERGLTLFDLMQRGQKKRKLRKSKEMVIAKKRSLMKMVPNIFTLRKILPKSKTSRQEPQEQILSLS